ncbi:MAG: hypothetical protein R3280_05745 [Marinobacter sp.]|uniref:hypothetical protein n=1 Tax=Marinobacter sp. TaxID=50741 RepID=UPI00299D7E10|nr:hypothetical protein [Marinobacter sp.]MDX1634116.1 hypothetical protein [Marinobacter sp.]
MLFNHEPGSLTRHIRFWWLLPLIVLIALFLAPLFERKQNVTVLLDDCVKTECELTGDLSVNLFTREFVLTRPDGSQVTFARDRVSFMHWESEPETE